jgi:outer membrane protein OmpA-like peptidoglycan-associated protein
MSARLLLGSALLLCGCASAPPSINPVDWYHNLEGGPIAKKRPPIPGAAAPYPNLANVPQPPHLIDPAERDRISATLLAERTHAEQEAALAPIPAASGAAPAAGTNAPSAPAASSPGPASTTNSAGAASAPPAAAGQPPPAQDQGQDQSPASEPPEKALAAAASTLPPIPAAPPPPPALAGFTLPGPPPVAFSAAQPPALTLQFAAGSADLSTDGRVRIRRLAAARGKASIAVVGYGDATESNAAAQAAALHLGLARASAVAAALAADGVPENALRIGAEASGGGAILRLLEEGTGT